MSCGDTLASLLGTSPPKIYCESHDGDEIQRFCKTCDIFVCLECVVGEHKGHNLLRINEFAESKKGDVLSLVKRVKRNHLVELQERIVNNREAKRVTKQCVSECIKQMNNRIREIRNYMEKIKKEMMQEIKEAQKYEFERLDDIADYLLSEENDIKTLVKLAEKSIESNKPTDMIMVGMVLEYSVVNLEQCPPAKIEEIEFCADVPLEPMMDNLFGYFRERKIIVEADEDKPTDLMVEKRIDPLISFQQAEDSLGCICPMKDGMVWISLTGESVVYLVKHGKIRKKEEFDGVIADIDITKDDHLIVAMKSRHRLLRIKPNGQKLDFIDLKPLYPNGLYITDGGDTYVSVIDNDSTEVRPDSKNCVIKYTNTGTGLQRFIKDRKEGRRLFTLPRKLVTTSDHDVCVIDALSLFSARIVSVNSLGDVNFIYYGREDLDMVTFNPIAIKRNSRDHIIVADFDNCFLHILNKEGQLLFLMTCNQPECIYGPSALGIDQSDSIWIGTYDGNVTKMTPYAKPKQQQVPEQDGQKTNTKNMTIGDVKRLKSPYQKPNGTLDSRASSNLSRQKTPVSRPVEKEKSIIKPQSQEKKRVDKPEGKEKSFTRQQSNNAMKSKVKSAMKRRPTLTRMSTALTREHTLIGESIQENEKHVNSDLIKSNEGVKDENKMLRGEKTNVKENIESSNVHKHKENIDTKLDGTKDETVNTSTQKQAEQEVTSQNKGKPATNSGAVTAHKSGEPEAKPGTVNAPKNKESEGKPSGETAQKKGKPETKPSTVSEQKRGETEVKPSVIAAQKRGESDVNAVTAPVQEKGEMKPSPRDAPLKKNENVKGDTKTIGDENITKKEIKNPKNKPIESVTKSKAEIDQKNVKGQQQENKNPSKTNNENTRTKEATHEQKTHIPAPKPSQESKIEKKKKSPKDMKSLEASTSTEKNGLQKTGKNVENKMEGNAKQQNNDDQIPKRKRHQCGMTHDNSGPKELDVKRNKNDTQKPKTEVKRDTKPTKTWPNTGNVITSDDKKTNKPSDKNGGKDGAILQTANKPSDNDEDKDGAVLQTATKHVRK